MIVYRILFRLTRFTFGIRFFYQRCYRNVIIYYIIMLSEKLFVQTTAIAYYNIVRRNKGEIIIRTL